jgi:F420-dependent oxidoreductase-like protein
VNPITISTVGSLGSPNVSYSNSMPLLTVARGMGRSLADATVTPMTLFGVHTGLQSTSTSELQKLWGDIEAWGFDWISIWDHFYGATGRPDDADCLEAVALHSALALSTSRVRCGSLVYSIGYRHPAVIAKAITAIDHLSNGRVDVGLGAGWAEVEYQAYGIDFPAPGRRLDQLAEGARVVRGLLHDEVTSYEGTYFSLHEARNEPRPLQAKVPIWIGGGGEKRTLRIAAEFADGWNIPFVAPETFAHKRDVLHQHCADAGRDPAEIRCAVNVGLAWTEDSLVQQFGQLAQYVRPGVLTGSDEEIIDRISQYVAAGADQVNIALRAPFDNEALDRFSVALGLPR